MNLISRIFKAVTVEITTPESFIKGEDFEKYVRDFLFPINDYTLIHKTHNYNSNQEDYIESSLKPDYQFRDKKNGLEFYVEAKWRNGFCNSENKISWCNPSQLKRYKEIDKNEAKVFIVLGIGGKPNSPNKIAIFPVSSCNYSQLYYSFIDKNKFYIDKPVFSSYLWNLK